MASLKDIYGKAKQKLTGEPAEDDYADSFDDSEEDAVNYDAINESVQPVTPSMNAILQALQGSRIALIHLG